jgi:hypothetical protein
MPNKIKPKRSYTANSVPLTTDLDTHELAINWQDGKAFTKDASGNIVSVTLGGGGGGSYTLPTASSTVLGGVKVGSGLTITDGVLAASGGSGEDAVLRAMFVPPAPTSLTATAGNAQVALSWTAPTVLAQTPITDYTVQYSSNGGSTWTTFSDSTSTATSATVTGLTNGTAYVFRVAAVNGAGAGSYSTASSSVTPIGPPAAPTNVTVMGSGNTWIEIAWSAPASNGGSAVTDYVIQYSSDSGATWTSYSDTTSTVLGVTVFDLLSATTYLFRVAAVNAAGTGPYSSPSSAIATGSGGGADK